MNLMHWQINTGLPILATTTDSILAIVFFALWALVAWAGAAKKKMDRQKPRIVPREVAPPRRPKFVRPSQQRPVVFAPQAPAPTPTPNPAPMKDSYDSLIAAPLTPPPPAFKALPQDNVQLTQIRDWSVSAPVVQNRNPGAASVRQRTPTLANSIHRWMQPKSLRSQFILTEIFQPPLALRDRDNSQK